MKKTSLIVFLILCQFLFSQEKENFDRIYVKTYLETSKSDFNKAIKVADSLYIHSSDLLHKTKSLMLSATLYQQSGDYKKAVDFALSAEKEVEKLDNLGWKTRIYGFLASQYRILRIYEQSKKYTDYCLETTKKMKDTLAANQTMGLMMQEKAYYELDRDNYMKSLSYIKKSQILLKNIKNNNDFYSANNEQLLGLNYFHLKQYEKAIFHYDAALKLAKNIPEIFLIGLIHDGKANAYLSLGKIIEAEKEISKAQSIALSTQYLQLKNQVYKTSERLFTAKKEVERIEEFSQKKDSSQAQLDIGKDVLVNSLIEDAENKVSKAQQSSFNKNIVLLIIFLILLLFLIYFFYYKRVQKSTYLRYKAIIAELNKRANEKSKYISEKKNNSDIPERINDSEESVFMTSTTEGKILQYLERFENSKLFLRNDISLPGVASYCKTNTKYLSRIINNNKKMDFNNYINTLRVNYVIEKLNSDSKYRRYKIATLAEEAGFSSQNKFATIFKKVTSISPSVFIKHLEEQNQMQEVDL